MAIIRYIFSKNNEQHFNLNLQTILLCFHFGSLNQIIFSVSPQRNYKRDLPRLFSLQQQSIIGPQNSRLRLSIWHRNCLRQPKLCKQQVQMRSIIWSMPKEFEFIPKPDSPRFNQCHPNMWVVVFVDDDNYRRRHHPIFLKPHWFISNVASQYILHQMECVKCNKLWDSPTTYHTQPEILPESLINPSTRQCICWSASM